jgi:hypothetical protein
MHVQVCVYGHDIDIACYDDDDDDDDDDDNGKGRLVINHEQDALVRQCEEEAPRSGFDAH